MVLAYKLGVNGRITHQNTTIRRKKLFYAIFCPLPVKERPMADLNVPGSVKLSGSLLRAARESAEVACRSTAGQIEYWAKLGRSVEEGGLSTIDAQRAISRLDFAGVHSGRQAAVSSLTASVLGAHSTGSLAQRVRDVVQTNRSQPVAAST
jgi:hypothetical protein